MSFSRRADNGQEADTVAEIVDNLRSVFQMVNEQSKKTEHEAGLTGPQLRAIKTIAREASIMVSEIARRMHLHPPTVVGILDRLEKQDLVKRVRSEKDRRVVEVELTEQGHDLVRDAPEVVQGFLVSGLEKLGTTKLKIISEDLDQMVNILGAQRIPPRMMLCPKVSRPARRKAAVGAGKSKALRRVLS